MKSTIVEKMLPSRLTTLIGIYIQTSAHLELAKWQIVALVEGEPLYTDELPHHRLKLKKSTEKLSKAFLRSSKSCPPQIGIRIAKLSSEIESRRESRNLAAHGAFYVDEEHGEVTACHYFSQGKGDEEQWYEINQRIPDRLLNKAVEELDQLLREAIDIRTELQELKTK